MQMKSSHVHIKFTESKQADKEEGDDDKESYSLQTQDAREYAFKSSFDEESSWNLKRALWSEGRLLDHGS